MNRTIFVRPESAFFRLLARGKIVVFSKFMRRGTPYLSNRIYLELVWEIGGD